MVMVVFGMDLFEYAGWLLRESPSAAKAREHPFAQGLLQAEYNGSRMAVLINLVIDPWFQSEVLPALAMPKCIRFDPTTQLLVACNAEKFVHGISILLSRICKQFPHLAAYHAHMHASFANLDKRFVEIFCEDAEAVPEQSASIASQIALLVL